jgi:hypothetical protein
VPSRSRFQYRLSNLLLDHRAYLARMAHDDRKLILPRFQDCEKLIDAGIESRAALRGIEAPAHGIAQRKLDAGRLLAEPAINFRMARIGDGGHGGEQQLKRLARAESTA